MTDAARSAGDSLTATELSSGPASKRRVSAVVSKEQSKSERGRSPRAKKATGGGHRTRGPDASIERRREPARALAKISETPQPAKTQVRTLLVGAGIGAAVTLSVVALGSKRGRGSAFALAVTKSISYAIARTTERGSLINLVAQAVGSAIA
jgi:hypothetical protein